MGAAQYFTIAFGAIIGTGWLTVLGSWLDQAGPAGAILAFALGGAVMMLVALCYAEVATLLPVSGGEVAFAYEVFGVGTCFATGWLLALVYLATTAFEAISAAWVTGALIPGSEGPVLYTSFGFPVRLSTVVIGVGGTLYLGYLNYRGVKSAARFQDLLTWALVGTSAVFIAAGLLFGSSANLDPPFRLHQATIAWGGIFAVLLTTPFWYAGFNMVPQALEEISPGVPVKRAGVVMLLSVGVAIAFYCLVILSSSMVRPWETLLAGDLPAARAFEAAFHSAWLAKLIILAALFGIVTSWNPLILASSRILFALGRAHIVAPRLGRVHPTHGTPAAAVIFSTAVAGGAVLLGRSAIIPIVNVSATGFAVAFLVTSLSALRLRQTQPGRPRPYRMPGGALTAAGAVLGSLGILFLALYQPYLDAKGSFPLEWAVLLGWSALGAVFWVLDRGVRGGLKETERRALIVGAGRTDGPPGRPSVFGTPTPGEIDAPA